jgi:hypothetical protein
MTRWYAGERPEMNRIWVIKPSVNAPATYPPVAL